MRKYVIACTILGLLPFLALAQTEEATIVSRNGSELCFGYKSQNVATLEMISDLPPFVQNQQIFVTYTWRAEHANGSKVWNTNRNTRMVPITFPGEHQITCDVEFVVLGSSTPFQVIRSNTIVINGKVCDDQKLISPSSVKKERLEPIIKKNE